MAELDITKLPAPRVPIIDERTGLISREWYRWFVNIFNLTGAGQTTTSISDLLVAPPGVTNSEAQVTELEKQVQSLEVVVAEQVAQNYELQKQLQANELSISAQESQIAEITKQLQALNLLPVPTPTDLSSVDKVVVNAGTAAEPSITTKGDLNTGVYFPAADKLAITVGGTESLRVDAAGIAIDSTKKFFLDGVAGTGDTYLLESASNTVDLYTGGSKRFTVSTTNIDLEGHVKIEGVTSTAATGSGEIVFNDSPTLITPNLGGFNGTVTPVTSITVANGVVTAVS